VGKPGAEGLEGRNCREGRPPATIPPSLLYRDMEPPSTMQRTAPLYFYVRSSSLRLQSGPPVRG
jgi:hypothetical protein